MWRSGRFAPGARELFCTQARRRVGDLFSALWANDDDANHAAALKVLDGRYTWIEEDVPDPSGDGPMIASQPEQAAEQTPEPAAT